MDYRKKVYVVGGDVTYANWLAQFSVTKDMSDADLVMFTGGEDVSPTLYKEQYIGSHTNFNYRRDAVEVSEFNRARNLRRNKPIPLIGICRGAQFLTAMAGGKLIQHQENPGYMHPIITWDGQQFPITSLHHQAMYPYVLDDKDYKLIAWAENHSKIHWNGRNEEISDQPFKEAEIVYYPKIQALGIQGHPEMMNAIVHAETFEFLDDLVERLIDKTL